MKNFTLARKTNDFLLNGYTSSLRAVVYAEFLVNVLQVGFDRVRRQVDGIGNVLVGLAFNQVGQDLEFSLGQNGSSCRGLLGRIGVADAMKQFSSYRRIDKCAISKYTMDNFCKVPFFDIFSTRK